jgi:hypothetical protein
MIGTATENARPVEAVTTAGAAACALEVRRICLVQLAGGPLTEKLERLEGARVVDVNGGSGITNIALAIVFGAVRCVGPKRPTAAGAC